MVSDALILARFAAGAELLSTRGVHSAAIMAFNPKLLLGFLAGLQLLMLFISVIVVTASEYAWPFISDNWAIWLMQIFTSEAVLTVYKSTRPRDAYIRLAYRLAVGMFLFIPLFKDTHDSVRAWDERHESVASADQSCWDNWQGVRSYAADDVALTAACRGGDSFNDAALGVIAGTRGGNGYGEIAYLLFHTIFSFLLMTAMLITTVLQIPNAEKLIGMRQQEEKIMKTIIVTLAADSKNPSVQPLGKNWRHLMEQVEMLAAATHNVDQT